MNGALAWLNDLMIWLGRWVPRLLLIPPTHCGVRFGPRGGARSVGSGLVAYWPITHAVLLVPITTQSVQPCAQVLPGETSDGHVVPRVVICSTAIQYRVVDAVKAATSALSLHALIDNRSSAAIARHFAPETQRADWMALARSELERDLEAYGVKVERLDLTGWGSGIALKNLADWSYADSTSGQNSLNS